MQWGYKTYIKSTANGLRDELGLSLFVAVDPRQACEFLGIPLIELTDLGDRPDIVAHFCGPAQAEFSAVTGFDGTRRFFVVNDSHHPYRQASSLTHELGHALLQHPPAKVVRGDGVRNWDGEIEEEAAFFSGVLLLPDEACRMILKRGLTLAAASQIFGVSTTMVDYRLNMSGARKIWSRGNRR